MALNQNVKVPFPEHGCVKRKMGDKVYVYYATAVYRNKKGQPTSDRVSIGRFDSETGMLIPNRNYYEVYLKTDQPITKAVFDYGVYYAFAGTVKRLGIEKALKRYFPEHYKEILTIAQYMLSEGNVMYYIDDYTETHKTYSDNPISDRQCSKVFAGIRQEDILLFLREWMQHKKENEYVAYDVTSISTYSKCTHEAEWGYNRDKEKLPQINMGMYYGEESKLPLYYRIYPGSISDKTHLKYMVEDNTFTVSGQIRYVMDRGFYSAENLQYLTEKGHRFIIALPGSLKYVKELIEKHGAEIVNRSEYKLGADMPYGKAFEVTELGFRMRVHLYYDPLKAANDSAALFKEIEKQENELRDMTEPPDRKLRYDRYFYINVSSKDGSLSFRRNNEAIDRALRQCGYFMIAETDFKKTTAEILELYRRRDVIEKSFDNLKNELDMKRLHIHSEAAAEGKTFVAFIALVIRSQLLKKLGGLMTAEQMTLRKALTELDKAKLIISADAVSGARLLNPPTRIQKDILAALDLEIAESVGLHVQAVAGRDQEGRHIHSVPHDVDELGLPRGHLHLVAEISVRRGPDSVQHPECVDIQDIYSNITVRCIFNGTVNHSLVTAGHRSDKQGG